VVMPVLARAKRKVAPVLGSRAAVSEANQTSLCALLWAVLLVGLAANALFGWWWADPAAGLGIAALAALEGVRTWRAESLADTCCDQLVGQVVLALAWRPPSPQSSPLAFGLTAAPSAATDRYGARSRPATCQIRLRRW
jgi:hypothetical protein